MATDGVKIIDGDTAHDTYWAIMDLYDSDANNKTIREKIPFPLQDYYDDFDYEIYTTAYALAIWEIGFITEDIIQEVRRVIDKGACVKVWTEEHDAQSGKERQKELDELWSKITATNVEVRKRKKYELIDKFLFEINDVLTFQLADSQNYAIVLLDITQYRGECTYKFGNVLYKSEAMPTIEDVKKCELIGRKIPSGFGMDMDSILSAGFEEIERQGGIEEILKREAERTGSYEIGMNMTGIDHRALTNIADKFTKVGNLNLKDACRNTGSLNVASTFEELTWAYNDLDHYISVFQQETFKIEGLLEN
jgi:hypothetical protein